MNSEWMTAESFERNQRLISAINTLSIHTKLAREGITNAPDVGDVAEAREALKAFLERVGPLVRDVEVNREAPILGADQRLSLLVRQFASTRQQRPSSILHTLPIERVTTLIDSVQPGDQDKLIEYLRALRQLVEQHAHADVVGLLGEV